MGIFKDLVKELNGINGVGSDLKPTINTSLDESTTIIKALEDCIGDKRDLLEKQDFAKCGKSVFRLDSPGKKPTHEIQRNGQKATGEQTTVACVVTSNKIQLLINSLPDIDPFQKAYNKILWEKLKNSLEKKKNMYVTLADLSRAEILAEFEKSFR
jgi:hypothetical protein